MKRSVFSLFLVCIVFLFSCKKNQLGGKSTVSGTVMHHSKIIGNATVFIKFNAKDFPGADTILYDSKVRADADGNYTFNCYKGDYFLYSIGIDNSITPPRVVGGLPVNIRNKETLKVDIAVTEG